MLLAGLAPGRLRRRRPDGGQSAAACHRATAGPGHVRRAQREGVRRDRPRGRRAALREGPRGGSRPHGRHRRSPPRWTCACRARRRSPGPLARRADRSARSDRRVDRARVRRAGRAADDRPVRRPRHPADDRHAGGDAVVPVGLLLAPLVLLDAVSRSRRVTTRGMLPARSRLCVSDDDAGSRCRLISKKRSWIWALVVESRLTLGSSARSSLGSRTSARASATRCCSPPDSSPGRCSTRSTSPTSLEQRPRAGLHLAPGHALDQARHHHVAWRALNSGSRWWN